MRLGDSRARRPRTPGPTRSRFATQGPCHWPCGPRVPIGASRQAGLPRQCRRQLTGASPGLTGPQCRLTRALARVTALVRWRALRPRRRAAAMRPHCGGPGPGLRPCATWRRVLSLGPGPQNQAQMAHHGRSVRFCSSAQPQPEPLPSSWGTSGPSRGRAGRPGTRPGPSVGAGRPPRATGAPPPADLRPSHGRRCLRLRLGPLGLFVEGLKKPRRLVPWPPSRGPGPGDPDTPGWISADSALPGLRRDTGPGPRWAVVRAHWRPWARAARRVGGW